jgi:putative lipoic acid-binding regulatory protein
LHPVYLGIEFDMLSLWMRIKNNKDIEFTDIPDGDNGDIYANLKEKLESVEQFPGIYNFKFIITGGLDKIQDLRAILPDDEFIEQASKTGKYVSITVKKTMQNADEVIAIYKQAGNIKGIMVL